MLRTFLSSILYGLCLALCAPVFAQNSPASNSEADSAQTEPLTEAAQADSNQVEAADEPPAKDAAAQTTPPPMPLSTPESVEKSVSPQPPAEYESEGKAEESEEARQARITELLTLVNDNTLGIHKRENAAYFALVKEVLRQTQEELRTKARENPRFDEFYRQPAKHRGEVVHLPINVRRVLPVEIKGKNEAGVTKLYELWGWTDEAKAWMYCCITPELPPGFPTEGNVAQRVELTGYFFKMQAYQPGDAAPNARNLVAPLVIGRITPAPKAAMEPAAGMGNWPFYIIGGFGLIILLRVMMFARPFSRSTVTHRNYRRRSLEPLDDDNLADSLGKTDRGLPIRNSDE